MKLYAHLERVPRGYVFDDENVAITDNIVRCKYGKRFIFI